MAKCRGCGADIVWAVTPDGKRQPFNRVPSADGKRLLLGRGPNVPPLAVPADAIDLAEYLCNVTGREPYDLSDVTYMPHHATCPDVGSFR